VPFTWNLEHTQLQGQPAGSCCAHTPYRASGYGLRSCGCCYFRFCSPYDLRFYNLRDPKRIITWPQFFGGSKEYVLTLWGIWLSDKNERQGMSVMWRRNSRLGRCGTTIGALQVTDRYDPLPPMLLGSAAQRPLGSLRRNGPRWIISATAAAFPIWRAPASSGSRDRLTRGGGVAVVARRPRWRVVAHIADERVFRK
jgi:hypothetical protein